MSPGDMITVQSPASGRSVSGKLFMLFLNMYRYTLPSLYIVFKNISLLTIRFYWQPLTSTFD